MSIFTDNRIEVLFWRSKKCCGWGAPSWFHKFIIIHDNGVTRYEKCSKCKSRKIIQPKGSIESIDWTWALGKTDTVDITKGVMHC